MSLVGYRVVMVVLQKQLSSTGSQRKHKKKWDDLVNTVEEVKQMAHNNAFDDDFQIELFAEEIGQDGLDVSVERLVDTMSLGVSTWGSAGSLSSAGTASSSVSSASSLSSASSWAPTQPA